MNELIEKKIKTIVHGRYLLKIPEGNGPFPLFFTFHGYGQNALDNMAQAQKIPGIGNWIICSVEGLSHFHLMRRENGHQKPGACWITFYEADQTISEIVDYIDSVADKVKAGYPCTEKLIYMGFSMGTIPAWASAAYGKHATSGVISVGYHIFSKLKIDTLKGLPHALVGRGNNDPHYTKEKMNHNCQTLENLGIQVRTCEYEGQHEWHLDLFEAAGKWLKEI
ncbi:MAG: hypothetical protein JXJ04_19865 [Spirochaetales bacterium]|nr:hypothetical protein [Spirochaetales bacterium]